MSADFLFYICPVCFKVCEDEQECHEHQMICCDPGTPGNERRRPMMDASGRVQTRAPRWFLEAVGWISDKNAPGG